MSLVKFSDIITAIKLEKIGFFGRIIAYLVFKLLQLDKINTIYDRSLETSSIPTRFLEALLYNFRVRYYINPKDLKRIPTKGPVVVVANHPLGGIDGIILLHFLRQIRPDTKLMANFLLDRIAPLKDAFISVNPFDAKQSTKSSVRGFREAIRHLNKNGLFVVFPAGEVAGKLKGNIPIDPDWNLATMRLIKAAKAPVVPVYFHARNTHLFYRLAALHGVLRTARLPAEMLHQKYRTIKLRIGKPISVKDQEAHAALSDYAAFLRKKVFVLANTYDRKNIMKRMSSPLRRRNSKIQPIDPSLPVSALKAEIAFLQTHKKSLLKSKDYELFLSDSSAIPNMVHEIGRQRELAFRAVGEGTNKAVDLDHYDTAYLHLFLWDHKEEKLVGAYRLGLGKELMEKHGLAGFYLAELFNFDPETHAMLGKTIELGRAFVAQQYQQRPMPLFLLWKGIIHATLRYPDYTYLMGSVSISNQFSKFTKSLMIEFMRSHYYDPYLAQLITPKKEFKVKLKEKDKEFVFDETSADLNKFDKLIDELEPGDFRLPVLIKKYIKQNARVVSFNVDPLFNNAIDGLMYIKIKDIPSATVQPVLEEFQASFASDA